MSTIHACWLRQSGNLPALLNEMLKASDYWQPDAHSHWFSTESPIGLAKAQLFNTARSLSDGVHHDADAGLTIASNARIDNRRALLQALGIAADDPRIATDGQLLLQCYRQWGKDCAAHLRGDFVFVIWDEAQQKLFCARDHFGVKVLFYSQNERGVMLSNEHNAFFTSGWCDKSKVDEQWLVENLWGLNPRDFDSPNPDIHVLPPAHTLEIDWNGKITLSQYWYLQAKSDWQHLDDEALIAELKHRFQRAVSARLDSLYPLGAELSEGLDSNAIAGFAARIAAPRIINTFSYQCAALTEENHSIWAETYRDIEGMLALHPNLQPVWETSSSEQFELSAIEHRKAFYRNFGGVTPPAGEFMRGPMAQPRGIRVMLSGWGGDHCVTCPGDEYAHELLQQGRLLSAYRLLRGKQRRGRCPKPLFSLLALIVAQGAPALSYTIKIRRRGLEAGMKQSAQQHFLSPEWIKRYRLGEQFEQFNRGYQRFSVRAHELRELFEISVTNRLTYSELISRQNRLEYRFPMLDVELVEFAHSLPSRLKIHQGIERYPIRRILEGVTTPRIQWRWKADVVHPNLDRGLSQSRRDELAKQWTLGKSVIKYSSEEAIKRYFKTTILPGYADFIADLNSITFEAVDRS